MSNDAFNPRGRGYKILPGPRLITALDRREWSGWASYLTSDWAASSFWVVQFSMLELSMHVHYECSMVLKLWWCFQCSGHGQPLCMCIRLTSFDQVTLPSTRVFSSKGVNLRTDHGKWYQFLCSFYMYVRRMRRKFRSLREQDSKSYLDVDSAAGDI